MVTGLQGLASPYYLTEMYFIYINNRLRMTRMAQIHKKGYFTPSKS